MSKNHNIITAEAKQRWAERDQVALARRAAASGRRETAVRAWDSYKVGQEYARAILQSAKQEIEDECATAVQVARERRSKLLAEARLRYKAQIEKHLAAYERAIGISSAAAAPSEGKKERE